MTTLSVLDVTDLTWALPAWGVYTHFPTEQKTAELTIQAAVSSRGTTCILFAFSNDLPAYQLLEYFSQEREWRTKH